MDKVLPYSDLYESYLRDESRLTGYADSISFPESEEEVIRVLAAVRAAGGGPVTIQGGRTGLTGGAVPQGGHLMNLSRMNRLLGIRREADGRFLLRYQTGETLRGIRERLRTKSIDADGWDAEDLAALEDFLAAPEQFFTPDPTETTAFLGGMIACNASGAMSYGYGAIREHVRALRVVLADGDVLALKRGEVTADGRTLTLTTQGGRQITAPLPTYTMPAVKNAAGYYIEDNIDAVDLFVASGGTLGIITEAEIGIIRRPEEIWCALCFFTDDEAVPVFTAALRRLGGSIKAIEYFDTNAIRIFTDAVKRGDANLSMPSVLPEGSSAAVFVELHAGQADEADALMHRIAEAFSDAGGDIEHTWTTSSPRGREQMLLLRHAVPENVNAIIGRRKETYPALTKLASDMAVPDADLAQIMRLYRADLADAGLEYAIWGHIGNSHLHVNILPRDMTDYAAGQEIIHRWADTVVAMGGTISAEHGVGRLKTDYLPQMYGNAAIHEMAALKAAFDPDGLLSPGVLFKL